jgi:hypothetical protein
MAKAPFNLAHSAAAVTLARYFAKRAVKDEWRKAGLKPRAAKELSLAAWAIPARALGRANRASPSHPGRVEAFAEAHGVALDRRP